MYIQYIYLIYFVRGTDALSGCTSSAYCGVLKDSLCWKTQETFPGEHFALIIITTYRMI